MLMFRLETKRTVDHEDRELGYQLKFSLQDTATEFDAKYKMLTVSEKEII